MYAKVTVICITFNHKSYIREALESFVQQKTTFPVKFVVADDSSTDGTTEIIADYAARYPKIIFPILRTKNIGALANYIETLNLADSEYVIINEGDDYFTDPYKLQKQVEFLDRNPNCAICFHPVQVSYENDDHRIDIFPTAEFRFNKERLTLDDLLKHNFIQTNSCMYRWRFKSGEIKVSFPKDILPCDYYLHLLHAQVGAIGYINEVMSVYRRHETGLWWESHINSENLHLRHGNSEIRFYLSVWKNISHKSSLYLENTLYPNLSTIATVFLENLRFEALHILKTDINSLDDDALDKWLSNFFVQKQSKQTQFSENPLRSKLVFYKRQRNILLALLVLLFAFSLYINI